MKEGDTVSIPANQKFIRNADPKKIPKGTPQVEGTIIQIYGEEYQVIDHEGNIHKVLKNQVTPLKST